MRHVTAFSIALFLSLSPSTQSNPYTTPPIFLPSTSPWGHPRRGAAQLGGDWDGKHELPGREGLSNVSVSGIIWATRTEAGCPSYNMSVWLTRSEMWCLRIRLVSLGRKGLTEHKAVTSPLTSSVHEIYQVLSPAFSHFNELIRSNKSSILMLEQYWTPLRFFPWCLECRVIVRWCGST